MAHDPTCRTHRGGSFEYGDGRVRAHVRECEDETLRLKDMGLRVLCRAPVRSAEAIPARKSLGARDP